MRQIAEASRHRADGTVELSLSPDDLGRVHLSMRHGAEGLSVQISADRSDTMDLIRRHIADLGRDFRDLGHADVAFSFADRQPGRQPQPQTTADPSRPDPEPTVSPPIRDAFTQPRTVPVQGLDIRL